MPFALRKISRKVDSYSPPRWIVPALVTVGVLALAALFGGIASPEVLGGVLVVFMIVVLVEKPEIGPVFLICAAYLVPLEVAVSSSISANAVIMLLPVLFVIWGLQQLRVRGKRFYWSRTYAPLLVFLLIAFIAWLAGNASWKVFFPKPGNLLLVQLGQWSIYVLAVIAYILAAHQTVNGLKWMTAAFLGLGVLALVGRYGGPFGALINPWLKPYAVSNGSFFVWITTLAAGQALFNRNLRSSWRIALFILAVAVPILGFWQNTDWASSWLPPLLALAILLWLRSRFVSVSFLVVLLLIFALFSGVLLGMYDWKAEREMSIGGRFILWESVLSLSAQQPLLGLGLTTYRQYFQFIPLLTEVGRWWEPNINSHNLYIDLFAQMGVVGLLVFGWVVYEIGLLGWRLRSRFNEDFEAGYVASALVGLGSMLFASAIVEWLLPFIYNVGFPGFRFSVMSWLFLGGLVALECSTQVPNSSEAAA